MPTVSEIAPDLFRISIYVPDFDLQFNQFIVRDAEPLLFHTGPRAMFTQVRDAVATVLDPTTIKWIGFSHFESDECGSLPEWQQLAPQSTAACSLVGKLVSVDDCMALRPTLGMGLSAQLAGVETALSLAFFCSAIAFVRCSRGVRSATPTTAA